MKVFGLEIRWRPQQPKPIIHKDWKECLKRGFCPDCLSNRFDFGARGGMVQNVTCSNCGSKFNLAPFDDGWLGEPFLIVRRSR